MQIQTVDPQTMNAQVQQPPMMNNHQHFRGGFDAGLLVPLGAFVMVLGIIITRSSLQYRVRKLQSAERLAAIEKGITLPDLGGEEVRRTPVERAQRSQRSGIILIALGVGLMFFFLGNGGFGHHNHGVSAMTGGIIPLMLGVGLLIDARLQFKRLASEKEMALQIPE